VGLSPSRDFSVILRLGNDRFNISLHVNDFLNLHQHSSALLPYFENPQTTSPLYISNDYSIQFASIHETPIIGVWHKSDSCVYLGADSVKTLVELMNTLWYNIEFLQSLNFFKFYYDVLQSILHLSGNVISNLKTKLNCSQNINNINVLGCLQLIQYNPSKIQADFDINTSIGHASY